MADHEQDRTDAIIRLQEREALARARRLAPHLSKEGDDEDPRRGTDGEGDRDWKLDR
jgi:hypothetical protein